MTLENNKSVRILAWLLARMNVVYKLFILAALLWIGVGLQDVTDAIYAMGDACAGDEQAAMVRSPAVRHGL